MAKENLKKTLLKSTTTAAAERVAATSEAAEEVVAIETTRKHMADDEQKYREQLIAKTHEMIGQIKSADMFSKFAQVSSLVWLKQVKESKIFKSVQGITSWEMFCKHIGLSRGNVDKKLLDLAVLGEEFLLTMSSLSVSYRDIRKLRSAAQDGQLLIEGNTVEINGNTIPLCSDHAEDLQAEIEALIDAKDRTLAEREATLKAKDRVLEEKEKVIQKQEEVIAKHEQTLKQRGFAPGEEEFLKDVETFSHTVQGLCLMVDPDNLPDHPTQMMTSTYIEALGKAWRTMKGYYDGACERFGDPLDDDWVPPNLRDDADPGTEEPIQHPCAICDLRKGKINAKKGVLIPDYHGKCTRDGGHCDLYQEFSSTN